MSRKRRMFDIDMPDDVVDAPIESHPVGTSVEEDKRRGPMASAIAESVTSSRERSQLEDQIRDENDALAHEHMRLKRMGLVIEEVELDLIDADKLVRDRQSVDKDAMLELTASIKEVGLSNPIQLERVDGDRYQLIQGFRRLEAYKALLDETKNLDEYAHIPALVVPNGETLEALYRKMVDENMVRKDISFAEMAQLAISYAEDERTEEVTADKAVALLFKSAAYQKRSYIRNFVRLIEQVGPSLQHSSEIPRALGVALSTKLSADNSLSAQIRQDLDALKTPTSQDELGVLRIHAGMTEHAPQVRSGKAQGSSVAGGTKSKTSFQFSRPEGKAKCVAGQGVLEVRVPKDFSMLDRRKLEQAINSMLDSLKE